MKKVLSFLIVLAICMSLAVPVLAAEDHFVPSITAKSAPTIKYAINPETGEPAILIRYEQNDHEIVMYIPAADAILTAIADVYADVTLGISDEDADVLAEAFEMLNQPDAKLSEQMPALLEHFEEKGLSAEHVDDCVVTDVFDLTINNEEAMDLLNQDGYYLDVTFENHVSKEYDVYVLVYKDNSWQMIKNAVNNGDGTITCHFEHLCPIAILTAPPVQTEAATEAATEAPADETPATEAPVEEDHATEAPAVENTADESENGGFAWWLIALVAAAGGAVVALKKKGNKAEVTE